MPGTSRLGSPYDAVLHLLDRQVLDRDGLMVCKVDDLELAETPGGLRATAILTGTAALLPRLGGRLGGLVLDYWHRLGTEQADRTLPYRIDFADITDVSSAVDLGVPREDLLRRPDPDQAVRRRLGDLLAMTVHGEPGTLGRVLDVRLDERNRVAGLVVGPGRPGSMLGYDRSGDMGPAAVRVVVRWLHRHVRYVEWAQVSSVDWARRTITVTGQTRELTPAAG